MARSIKYLLQRRGLDKCPTLTTTLDHNEVPTPTPKKSKQRIPIEHTIEVFERCLKANQCPGKFLGEEIIICLNELKEDKP